MIHLVNGRCTTLPSPGRTTTGTRFIYRLRCVTDNSLLSSIRRGSAVSVPSYPCPSDRISPYFMDPADNKPFLASRSSRLTSSRDQDRFSIPLVCPCCFSL